MMINKIVFVLCVCFVFQGCSAISKDEKIVDSRLNCSAQSISKNLKIIPTGTGLSMPEEVLSLKLCFESDKTVDVPTARIMFITAAEKFINEINNDTKIRPYLHHYPFGPDDIEISLSYVDENYTHRCIPHVAHVSIIRGIIYYSGADPNKAPLQTIYSEPYQEALKIVREGRQN